jgi:alginate O-acetyltransferase complex protein AlgJ
MPDSTKLDFLRKASRWILIIGFIGLLWLPALDSLFNLDKAPVPNENRAPASFPAFALSFSGIRSYVAGLENYYNDHFGFRKQLIRWEHRWRRSLFNQSSLADVITGREGWLYYSGERMIENYRGMTRFETKELKDWQALLESRRDWLARRGIRYLFVIPPNKDSVYP